MINLNVSPYYDDFYKDSPNGNGFSQILFKPGVTVQARELTQIQTILRDQIAKFGSHVFKHGSVVLPGNSTSDLSVGYVKLTGATDITYLTGQYVTNLVTGLKAYVKQVVNSTLTDPRTLIVSYVNSGSDGSVVFPAGATLTPATGATVDVDATTPTGGAALASVNRGVFFVNGTFVGVEPQTIVISKYSSTPNCHVLLQVVEEIIGADTDLSLLDPSQGTGNYAAPGADRIKISLILTTLPYGTVFDSNYIELMRFNSGVLEEHLRYAQYSELEKNLARRTYDESGDYVVSGLKTTTQEYFKTSTNGGRYLSTDVNDLSKFIYSISDGKAYLKGFEKDKSGITEIISNKGRTNYLPVQANAAINFGQFFYVSSISGLPSFVNKTQITIQHFSGTTIGTANVVGIDFHAAVTSSGSAENYIYKLYFSDLYMIGNTANIGSCTFTDATVGGTKTIKICAKTTLSQTGSTAFAAGNTITNGARSAIVQAFSAATGEYYLYKIDNVDNSMVQVGDVVATGSAVGKINSLELIGRNKYDNLLAVLPSEYTKTITSTTYKAFHEFTTNSVGSAATYAFTAPSGQTFDTPTPSNMVIIAYVGTTPTVLVVSGTTTSLSAGNTVLTITFGVASVTSCKVIAELNVPTGYSGIKTKDANSFTQNGVGITSGRISLAKSDGIRVTSVIDTSNSQNVTSKFKFDGGQRDYAYTNSFLTLKEGETVSGTTFNVIYDYFTHTGTGDYFSIDSYASYATFTDVVTGRLTNLYDTDLLFYKSQGSGIVFDLRNCIDFRPTYADNSTTTLISTSRVPVVGSLFSTTATKYIGRVDAIILDKSGSIKVIEGLPGLIPKEPSVSPEAIYLATAYVPPYVLNISNIRVVEHSNKVYTMKSIGNLEKRISNIEDYVTLSQTETSIINYDIIDGRSGLSRFKSGYLVDTFNNADIIADVFNKQFTVAYESGKIIPQFEVVEAEMIPSGTQQLQNTGGLYTLPYDEVVMAQQKVSSGIVNVNPFAVFSYQGNLTLTPSVDTWTDIQSLPTIIQDTVENVVVTRSWGQPGWAGVSIQPAPRSGGGGFVAGEFMGTGLQFAGAGEGGGEIGGSWGGGFGGQGSDGGGWGGAGSEGGSRGTAGGW